MSLFTPTPLSTHTTAAPMRASPIVAAMPPYWIRSSFWNPDGVELPGCVNLKSPPSYLDKSLVGDVGFDPLCLVPFANPQSPTAVLDVPLSAEARQAKLLAMSEEEQAAAVNWMREAELKHGRIAMLAAAGWPLAELWNPFISLDGHNGRAPSLFNGGLFDFPILPFFLLAMGGASYLELQSAERAKSGRFPGDLGFDPLGIYYQEGPTKQNELRLQEIKNGRLAMMAITGFSVQEFLWGTPVIKQPFHELFFGR